MDMLFLAYAVSNILIEWIFIEEHGVYLRVCYFWHMQELAYCFYFLLANCGQDGRLQAKLILEKTYCATEILRQRFAQGEISKEEFESRSAVLEGKKVE